MDVRLLHNRFIEDRRLKEPVLIGAPGVERHHIKPRCIGGGDEVENLILLTYQDHLFVHFLLAKIHGGALAQAFYMMLSMKRYEGRASRRIYQSLREEASSHNSRTKQAQWSDPEKSVKLKEAFLDMVNNPEVRAKNKENKIKLWQDPAHIGKQKMAHKSPRALEQSTKNFAKARTPEAQAKAAETQRRLEAERVASGKPHHNAGPKPWLRKPWSEERRAKQPKTYKKKPPQK